MSTVQGNAEYRKLALDLMSKQETVAADRPHPTVAAQRAEADSGYRDTGTAAHVRTDSDAGKEAKTGPQPRTHTQMHSHADSVLTENTCVFLRYDPPQGVCPSVRL